MIARLFPRGHANVVLEPYRLAREDAHYTVQVSLSDFPRIAQALGSEGEGGLVAVDVRFFRDEEGRACAEGTLTLQGCQRCANCEREEALALTADVALVVVRDEAAQALYAGVREPITLEGKKVPLAEMFEDDLLLALPERPCAVREAPCPHAQARWAAVQGQAAPEPAPKRENPFAALAQLKGGQGPKD
jgi:uncharacterized protein